MEQIKIFVENISARNREDSIKGAWFNLPVKMDYLSQKLGLEKDDEYIIADYEAPFLISENKSIVQLNTLAQALGEVPKAFITHMSELIGNFFDDPKELIEDWKTVTLVPEIGNDKEYGKYLIDTGGYTLPSELENYIDYEAFGRDDRINRMVVYTDAGAFYK